MQKKQENLTHHWKKNWPIIETDPEMAKIMELADKNFKSIIRNMIKDREKNINIRGKNYIFKMEFLQLKNTMKWKIHLNEI